MKRLCSILIGVSTLLALGSLPVAAQRWTVETRRSGWLGISYETRMVRSDGRLTEQLMVDDVVDGSPAQHAGLQSGDQLLRINGITASERFLASLSASLVPGDTVRLRIRRTDRERDITVIAGPRPAQYLSLGPRDHIIAIDQDSVRGILRMYMDSARLRLDSLRLPYLRIEGLYRDSLWRDSLPRAFYRDSLFGPGGRFELRLLSPESLRVHMDSLWVKVAPEARAYRFDWPDSLVRKYTWPDSILVRKYTGPDSVRGHRFIWPDSVAAHRFEQFIFPRDSAGVYLGRRFASPVEVAPFMGVSVYGDRGVAGAELTRIEPGLGDYFGTDTGVLVLRVADRTPAADAGLRAGDVIVRADGKDVTSVSDLRRIVAGARTGRTIPLEILRKKQDVKLEFKRE